MSIPPPDHADDPPDVTAHNAEAWNAAAARQDIRSTPVTDAEIDAARRGEWTVRLTPNRPVPAGRFPPLPGLSILGLASGGGQQTPLFAAAGAEVTVADISSGQLDLDQRVADEHGLDITTLRTDAADLPEEEVTALVRAGRPLEHSHTLEQQIGGQLAAGFHLLDLYEDTFDALAISAYLPTSIATRALKPGAD